MEVPPEDFFRPVIPLSATVVGTDAKSYADLSFCHPTKCVRSPDAAQRAALRGVVRC
jgi:hypothetical protein